MSRFLWIILAAIFIPSCHPSDIKKENKEITTIQSNLILDLGNMQVFGDTVEMDIHLEYDSTWEQLVVFKKP